MKIALIIGCMAILLNIALAISAPPYSPHLLSENCQSCHLATSTITKDNAKLLINSQEILCSKCHPNATQASHPSGFTPNRKLPDIFPLNWQGSLTCSSCHLIHGKHQGLMVTERKGKELCYSCHDKSFFRNMKDSGMSLFISGHLVADDQGYGEQMDAYSAQCISCHINEQDDLNVRYAGNGIISHSGGRVSHPIGSDYQTAAKIGGYFPMSQLDKRIVLPDGKVSCISCHSGYGQEHGKSVMSNEGSNLCYQCHNL